MIQIDRALGLLAIAVLSDDAKKQFSLRSGAHHAVLRDGWLAAGLAATFFVLGAGNYGGTTGLVHAGGYLGLAVAAPAAYLSCAELCESAYKRTVLPVWPLAG